MNTKVIKFPEPTEVDKQFLELEKQRELIREQKRLLDERKK
jgi:hypothetical protein